MRSGDISCLAAISDQHISTVSRVLRNCGGVDSAVREQILCQAEKCGVVPSDQPVDIYEIFPDAPAYRWKPLYTALHTSLSNMPWNVKLNLYSRWGDAGTVLRYLSQAARLSAKVIIYAGSIDDPVKKYLHRLAESASILLVCPSSCPEGMELVGMDGTSQGYAMGKMCADCCPADGRLVVLSDDKLPHTGGLTQVWRGEISLLPFSGNHSPIAAAHLAGQLQALYRSKPFCGVVNFTNPNYLVCQAVKKCGLSVPCFGVDSAPGDAVYVQSGLLHTLPGNDTETLAAQLGRSAAHHLIWGN